jgi:glucokinase
MSTPRGPLAVGIDLGGTQVRAALVDAQGAVLARAATRTDAVGGPWAVMQQIKGLVGEVTQGVLRPDLAGVGVSAPGPLDSEAGMIVCIPTLPGWIDVPIVALLKDALRLPVVLENDGVAAAIGEWRFGAGRSLRDFVYITVSTGIGGGVIADGRVLRGRRRMAAHLGHMTTAPEGELCSCGNRGCWEAQASGTALGQAARDRLASAPASSLTALGPAVTAVDVVAAAQAGDAFACALMAREAELLGIGIVNLLHLYSPEAVVMGGGVSQAFDLLQAGITQWIAAHAMPPFRTVPVHAAALGQNAGLVGAASIVFAAAD